MNLFLPQILLRYLPFEDRLIILLPIQSIINAQIIKCMYLTHDGLYLLIFLLTFNKKYSILPRRSLL